MSTCYSISDRLFLVSSLVPHADATIKLVEPSVNHIAIVDCSGSMGCDLPQIREQLKKKLPTLLKEGDTLSIIWFSGRGEFGVLVEGEPLPSLKDLQNVEKAIDRWLRPVGLTGFKEPILEVENLVKRVSTKNSNPFALFFMSDGCDNQWNRKEIIDAVTKVAPLISSSAFVEYGYYADRPLLTQMAEKMGGSLIFSENFKEYEPIFEAAVQKRSANKRIEVSVPGDPIGGFVFALDQNEFLTFEVLGNKVLVPENLSEVFYLNPDKVKGSKDMDGSEAISACYAALSLFANRMKSDIVYALLKNLGDVRFIDQFANCFGKQKYSEFVAATKSAAFLPELRFLQGKDCNKLPAEDAFTVLDLLQVLSEDKSTHLMLDSPEFKYNRVSRGRVEADENFSSVESEAIAEITTKMAAEKNAKKLKALQEELSKLTAGKQDPLKFVTDPSPDGYPMSGLTLNEERPNISCLIRKTGKVDLAARLATASADIQKAVPSTFSSFIFRNYTVVCDGIINVEKLPVQISKDTWSKLLLSAPTVFGSMPKKYSDKDMVELTIPLRTLPVVNRKMVKEVSAKALLELEWALTKNKAAQKVYNTYKKDLVPKTASEGFKVAYGSTSADWLTQQGFTDYSGFSPKMVQAEQKDVYTGKILEVSLKGYASLPSVKEVKEKMAKGKELTGCASLMAPVITEVENFIKNNPANLHATWLESKCENTTATVRGLIYQAAKVKFSIVVGQTWPVEFSSLDQNTMTIKCDGKDVVGKLEMKEIEVKV